MFNTISKTLQIKDKNFYFEDKVEERRIGELHSLVYFAKLTYTPERCEHCKQANEHYSIIKNGFKQTLVKIPKVSEVPAFLSLKKQRFHCRLCDHHFTAQTSEIQPYHNISNRHFMSIIHKATDTCSMKSIAYSSYVSTSTVSRYINEASRYYRPRAFDALPENIMRDEFSSVKNVEGKMSFIFADALTHRIVDITPDRRLYVLKDYFARYSLNQRKKVKTVTIDMYEPYMSLVKELFPKAHIIIDHFHIIQALQRALNIARVELMNTFKNTDRPLYNKFKRYWRLLLKPQEHLDALNYKKVRLFKTWQSEQSIINYLLSIDKDFRELYQFVHHLGYALRQKDYEKFYHYIETTKITHFNQRLRTVIGTFKKYDPYIKNTLTDETLTNGPIEGINNKTKTLKKVAYGYRNWDNMRNRLIIINKFFASQSKKELKRSKVA